MADHGLTANASVQSLGRGVFPLLRLLADHRDVGEHVLKWLTRRQALLLSGACTTFANRVSEALATPRFPFRPAVVAGAGDPGRLVEIDALLNLLDGIEGASTSTSTTSNCQRCVMWNAARERPFRATRESKRGDSTDSDNDGGGDISHSGGDVSSGDGDGSDGDGDSDGSEAGPGTSNGHATNTGAGPGSVSGPQANRDAPKRLPPNSSPWLTGVTVGPPGWEEARRQWAAAAAAQRTAKDEAAAARGAAAIASEAPGRAAAARVAAAGAAAQPPPPQRRWPALHPSSAPTPPLTLYACHYEAPGVVAYDGTSLLPLGLLVRLPGDEMGEPEGICASHDRLYVVNAHNTRVACISLQPPGPRHRSSNSTNNSSSTGSGHGTEQLGGGGGGGGVGCWRLDSAPRTPFGQGVVMFTVVCGRGWTSWGLELGPLPWQLPPESAPHHFHQRLAPLSYRAFRAVGQAVARVGRAAARVGEAHGEATREAVALTPAAAEGSAVAAEAAGAPAAAAAAAAAAALYIAADRGYQVARGCTYSNAPPPRTSGVIICVPLAWMHDVAARTAATSPGGVLYEPQAGHDGPFIYSPPPAGVQAAVQGASAAAAAAAAGAPAAPAQEERVRVSAANVERHAVLRRPSGLRLSPCGRSLWTTSYDGGLVELAGPMQRGPGPAGQVPPGTVLRVLPLPLPLRVPTEGGPVAGRRRGRGHGSGRGQSGRGRGRGAVMLPWDVAFVPRNHLRAPVTREQQLQQQGQELEGVAAQGQEGHGAASAGAGQSSHTLCVTLHEDTSQHKRPRKTAELRLGIVLQHQSGCDGIGDHSAGSVAESIAGEVGVQIVMRRPPTADVSHVNNICVC